ncbi:hypothetical protein C8A00DRAFT_41672 [Chaetomidium leptoderma]|uniref:F-box domain-containing protein n=1 Tax=Chaetomidium leptoderma TaxID=669021 RepID=A0AAN6VQK8_9PEZI|nr:hypothetical protein C8A00DRAFT_41672 [Chaetomidium leptoderma]
MTTMLGRRKEPAPLLLRLPPLIRHGIYRFINTPLDLDQPSPDKFHGLLLSCRDIYAEAAALLYSANRFVLHYTDPGSLEPLLALTAPALSSLATLKIVLNQASCHQRTRDYYFQDCCLYRSNFRSPPCGGIHPHQHQRPLLSSAPEGNDDPLAAAQALLGEWRAAASHLSPHITPRRLELSLVCDIDPQHEKAVDLANSALEPLGLFPLLRSCHIRLCKTPDSRLRQAAQDAVLQSYGISTPYLKPTSPKATFVTLPRELRLRILELTDLVTPNKEVWWSRQDSKYLWSDAGGCLDCLQNTWSHCQFFECWYRTITYKRTRTGPFVGCFCRRRHAAFSATCTCWAPPGPALFLVCHALYRDAQLVFFSANRFIVHDFQSSLPWALPCAASGMLRQDYPYKRLAASQFLQEVIPTHCIAYLRFLELVFPPYLPPTWPQTDHPAMRDWRETVGWLRDKINGPALTLRLVGAGISYNTPEHYAETITVAEGDMIYRSYMDLLQPLKQLTEGPGGLARFYADLPYPWQWTEESENHWRGENGEEWRDDKKRVLKKNAERRVMGDRYDRLYANGKEEPGQSLWQHVFYQHV